MKFIFILLASLCFPVLAQTFSPDERPILTAEYADFVYPEDLPRTNLQAVRASAENPFEWAGRMMAGSSGRGFGTCSAGVVRLPGGKLTDKALVLTAGHCLPFGPDQTHLLPKTALLDYELRPHGYEARFEFLRARKIREANGQIMHFRSFAFPRVIFAAFDVLDLAILEMDETYEQLLAPADQKFPYLVAHEIYENMPIRQFGLPNDDRYAAHHFHQSQCAVAGTLWTRTSYGNTDTEEEYVIRNRILNTCTAYGGMSGGYVRNAAGEVIGVASGGQPLGYNFYADASPLVHCATAEGKFDRVCLQNLKLQIEAGKDLEQR